MNPKRAGVHEVAKAAGVSIGTVDRALHGRTGISETTRQRVMRAAEKLGYRPNLAARALSGRKGAVRIAVCVPREIHYFYDQLWAGVRREAQYWADFGVEFSYHELRELGAGENAVLRKILQSSPDGLVVTPGHPEQASLLLTQAESQGTRVVCVSTDAPASKRSGIVCVDPLLNGALAGELMAKCLQPGAAVAAVTGMLSTEDHARKTEGFTRAFFQHCPKGSMVGVVEAHENQEESFRRTRELLKRFSSLAGIYVNTVNCLPVCEALVACGVAGKVKLITTDLFEEMVPYLTDGTIALSIYQHPYQQGRLAVQMLADHLVQGIPIPPRRNINPGVALLSNLHLFRELQKDSPADGR
jgi:LacI family transcriptional regulator